jgi:hypothetical protein
MSLFINNSFTFITNHLNDIILVSLGILVITIFKINFSNLEDNDNTNIEKKTKKEIIIEGFNKNKTKSKFESVVKNSTLNFCERFKGNNHLIEKKCNSQSNSRCKTRNCCVLIKTNNTNKCVSGNKFGPTYHTDEKGNELNIDYYYYHDKCYGDLCPK